VDSFLVQVWIPADGAPQPAQLRGVVRHVASGTETPFRNDNEVLHVLHQATGRHPAMPLLLRADRDDSTDREEIR